MATQAELQASIAELDTQIKAGVKETVVDGTKVAFDIDAKKAERTRLQRRLAKLRRPTGHGFARGVDLGAF